MSEGFKAPIPPLWLAQVAPVIGQPAFRSLFAFWLGGAGNGTGTPPQTGSVDYIVRWRRRQMR
jgi:hypothetical protein